MITNSRTQLLIHALETPRDERTYKIVRELRTLYPDHAVVPASETHFDVWQFAADGHCRCVRRYDVEDDFQLYYEDEESPLGRTDLIDWCNVTWQEHQLEIIRMAWPQDGCNTDYFWVVAISNETAHRFLQAMYQWNSEVRGEVLVYQNGDWDKDEDLFKAIKSATFENLVLPERLRKEIQDDFEQFFRSKELYERYRIPWKRGVILTGPPGNGKTHTIKALINWLNVPCLYVKSIKARYRTEQACLRDVFDRARKVTPCILVMEDIDSLITDQNRSFFLNEMDGFSSNTGIVVIASTNHPERLDPALLDRPSRFDRKYLLALPAADERSAYLRRWADSLEDDQRMSGAEIDAAVAATEGFSFAYLKELVVSALMRWISHPERLSLGAVVAEQCALLREQMASAGVARADSECDVDGDE